MKLPPIAEKLRTPLRGRFPHADATPIFGNDETGNAMPGPSRRKGRIHER